VLLWFGMAREITPDFAKLAAQAAIGQGLRSHFGVPDEFPSLFHSLIERMDRQDAARAAARFPSKPTQTQNRAASITADVLPKGSVAEHRGKAGVTTSDKLRASALLARAEEVRTVAETMQGPDAHEAMCRIAATYEKIARSIMKSPDALKDDPTSQIG
jgi:hypothetical protein